MYFRARTLQVSTSLALSAIAFASFGEIRGAPNEVDQLSICAGYYEAMSEANASACKPANSKMMHNLSLGSRLAAIKLLADEESFNQYSAAELKEKVESELENAKVYFLAQFENSNLKALALQDADCKKLLPRQAEILAPLQ